MVDVPLRDWVEERVLRAEALTVAAESRLNAVLAERDRQVTKAFDAQQSVNATQNEFRGTLKDQAATLATKESTDIALDRLRQDLDDLKQARSKTVGRETLTHPVVMLLVGAAIAYVSQRIGTSP